jgi:manganese/zinc/iron transport system permease protein
VISAVEAWILLTGVLATVSCSLLGAFLVLRKMSLIGDALSHAVLPGIVIAFLLSGSRDVVFMFAGAAVFGVLATILIETFHRRWRVQEDAAIGIVFTALFALGVVLVSAYTGHVDLDQECVLYGEIAYTPWDVWTLGDRVMGPRPVWILGTACILTVGFVVLFFKELQISSFDPAMAVSVGINATIMHYALMVMVSITTVAAFESVGAILVVAMFIVPGAAAYLWSNDLKRILWLSVAFAVISAVGGYALASVWNSSIAGAMVVAVGGVFLFSVLVSPSQGLLGKALVRTMFSVKVVEDHLLLGLIRQSERNSFEGILRQEVPRLVGAGTWVSRSAVRRLSSGGLVRDEGDRLILTAEGERSANSLLRSHRLWETYLSNLGLPQDHTHLPADLVEHFIDAGLRAEIAVELGGSKADPQGKPIPSEGADSPES